MLESCVRNKLASAKLGQRAAIGGFGGIFSPTSVKSLVSIQYHLPFSSLLFFSGRVGIAGEEVFTEVSGN